MKILIVGAGIAGLAAAKAFEAHGHQPDIIERRTDLPTAGQSIFLLGNAMRALGELGLQTQVYEHAYSIPTQTILSSRGKVLNRVITDSIWSSCGPCVAVHRRSLVDLMLKSLTNTRIGFETTVVGMHSSGARRKVFLSDGRTEEYDLVIGADGIRSSTRASVFPATAPRSVGLSAWRLSIENTKHGIEGWTAMLGAGRTLLAIPLSRSEIYLYADCFTKDFGDGSISTLKRLFREFDEPLGSFVRDLGDDVEAHRAEIEEVPSSDYISDHLALIGDAAHASSPSMAQGAGMAIEDAIVLAECVSKHQPLQSALLQFHELRKHRIEWVQKQSRSRDKLRTAPDLIRNTMLRFLGHILYRVAYGSLIEPFPR